MKPSRKKRAFASTFLVVPLLIAGMIAFGSPTRASAATWWQPGQITAWAYMIGYDSPITVPSFISSPTGTDPNTAVDIDLGDQDGSTSTCPSSDDSVTSPCPLTDGPTETSVQSIHAAGAHAICYVDVGTAEDWRSDYSLFDPSELGSNMPDWPGEKFIDFNDWSTAVPTGYETIQQIMANRFALCKEEGFDAIEADNVDAYTDGDVGDFTLTMQGEEQYINELVQLAHGDGLAYFLKNEINGDSLLDTEAPLVDGEIDEQCWQYSECSALDIFVQEGKPIVNVEYDSPSESALCPEANAVPMASDSENVDVTTINYSCSEYGDGEQPYPRSTTSTTNTTQPAPTTSEPTTSTSEPTPTTREPTPTTREPTPTTREPTTTTTEPTTTTREPTTSTTVPTTTPHRPTHKHR